jgi:S1-C subfamily serine protease/HEAT repeat protein
MQLSFSCPSCGKDYDLPWSLAGKRARCKQCGNDFVIPTPFEPGSPRSSEAIPVMMAVEPPRAGPLPRTSWTDTRPPESPQSATPIPEPPRPAPLPRIFRAEPPPSEPPLDAIVLDDDDDDEPIDDDDDDDEPAWPEYAFSKPVAPATPPQPIKKEPPPPTPKPTPAPAPVDDQPWPEYAFSKPVAPARPPQPIQKEPTPTPKPTPAPAPVLTRTRPWADSTPAQAPASPKAKSTSKSKAKSKSKSKSKSESTRPPWFLPSVVGGSIAAVLAVNVSLFHAFFGGSSDPVEQQAEANPEASLAGLGQIASNSAPTPPPVAQSSSTVAPNRSVAPPKSPGKAAAPKVAPKPVEDDDPDRAMSTSEIVAKYEPSVALIKGKKGTGTGFIARPGIVATNSHVIDGERMKDVEVRFPSAPATKQGPYTAKLLFQDKDRDLALLSVATDLPPVKVAVGYKFRKGEDVTVIGNPGVGGQMILENAISRGIVSSMTKLKEHVFLQLGISINPGNSGGPVFDPKGRVIGVVTLKSAKQEGLAFAVPAEDLLSALDTAESVASSEPAEPGNPTAGGPVNRSGAPTLVYAWKLGQTYVYSFDMSLDAGTAVVVLKGNSIYRVKAVDAEGITLGHRGWYTTTLRGKDGKVPPGGSNAPKSIAEIELKIDPQGEVLKASGSSPLSLLGDFAMLLIEPLPDDPQRTWDDSKTITLSQIEQVPGSGGGVPKLGRPGLDNMPRGGIRSRTAQRGRLGNRQPAPPPPQQQPTVKITTHEATEETTYTLGEQKGDSAPIRKNYVLATREMVGKDPRLKMIGDGTIGFDVKAGIPLSLDYKLTVVENSGNATFRLPITVSCKLLEGKDREKGLKPPVNKPAAMNKIDSGDLSGALANLKSPDANRRREACRFLFDAAPIENKRGEVSRVLEKLANDKDMGVRSDVIKAMGVWGDKKIVDALIASLNDESFGVRDELFEALSRLSPTEKAAEAIIPWLAKDSGRAQKALRAIGPPAEGPLLRVVEQGTDLKIRQEACRLLKDVGTSQSVPILERLAAKKQDAEIGRRAAEAIKNITRRYPSDADWEALLKQARSADGFKRREAVERISKIRPVEARRQDVARMLESLVAEDDRGIQGMAIRALGSWGDAGSRTVLIEKFEQPDFRQHREATEALIQLGPDEACARAIASRVKTDWDFVLASLSKVGPPAEAVAISLLRGTKDVFFRNELCRILGRIGSAACLPALREACAEPFIDVPRNAIKDLESRLSGGGMGATVADLRAADGGRRMDALKRLACIKPPPGPGRDEVARALDGLWESDDVFMKGALREAVSAWGDDKSVEALVEFLSSPDPKQWEEAMGALVKLRPDVRTAELLVSKFSKDSRRVTEIGTKFPTLVEVPLLAIVQGQGEVRWRQEACTALGQLGTPASLPALQALGGREGDEQIARDAQDALKAIKARL